MDQLREVADVEFDPWIEHQPIRLYSAEDLAARVAEVSADLLVCEADECKGPVFEQPLRAVASPGATHQCGCGRGPPRRASRYCTRQDADAVAGWRGAAFAVSRVDLGRPRHAGGTVFTDTLPYSGIGLADGRPHGGAGGLGAVGRAAKWRFEGLGMKVIACDPYQPDADCELDELLTTADVVSMHAPVIPETAGMIGAKQFAAMQTGAVYVNTARAALHDTDALVEALASGHLGGAGLDHVQGEILPPDHPLTTLDNVVLTPHIGGATYDTEVNQTDMVVEDICRLLAGERPHRLANPEVWR